MPVITWAPADHAHALQSRSSEPPPQVGASTCVTRCLYNIPPTVMTVLLPGLVVFVTGLAWLGVTASAADSSGSAISAPTNPSQNPRS